MDRAQVPGAPFTPNTRKDWGYAILFGLALSLGLVVSIEHFDDKLKTPEDVTRRLGVPVLGLLPAVRGAVVPVVSNSVPPALGEAVRSLRTSLVFTSGSVGTRIVALTSTQPGEGKTTAACNLAMVLALGGAKTLIIDADMRRPNLHTLLGLKNSVGLSDLLTGKAPAQQAIQRTEDPNLFALTAGQVPSNPSELLSSPRMRTLLNRLECGRVRLRPVDHRHAARPGGHRRGGPLGDGGRCHVRHRRGDDPRRSRAARDRDAPRQR